MITDNYQGVAKESFSVYYNWKTIISSKTGAPII